MKIISPNELANQKSISENEVNLLVEKLNNSLVQSQDKLKTGGIAINLNGFSSDAIKEALSMLSTQGYKHELVSAPAGRGGYYNITL